MRPERYHLTDSGRLARVSYLKGRSRTGISAVDSCVLYLFELPRGRGVNAADDARSHPETRLRETRLDERAYARTSPTGVLRDAKHGGRARAQPEQRVVERDQEVRAASVQQGLDKCAPHGVARVASEALSA